VEAPELIRGRFGRSETVTDGEAEGRPVRAAQVSVRSFNFGQHWRTPGVRNVRYSITLPLAFVEKMLRRALPEYVEDCIEFPDDDPLETALRRNEWPETGEILDDPQLCALALEWIAHDCLFEWLGDGEPKESPGYVLNTVDMAERQGNEVRFAGSGRAAGQVVKYQDV
jgi:hypothetical protein